MWYKIITILSVLVRTVSVEPATARQSGGSPTISRPTRVCVLLDHSASMIAFAVDLPTMSQLHALQVLIVRTGGSIGYGIVQEDPSTALLRTPQIPAQEAGVKSPGRGTNVFARAKLERQYERDKPLYQAREKARVDSATAVIQTFEKRLVPFISGGAGLAQESDLWNNVRRCETYLMEPVPPGQPEPERFLLLVSDGRHNKEGSKFEPVDKSITVLSVSGAQGLGDTAQIGRRVLWFEGVGGAINYIVAAAGAHNDG